MNQVITLAAVVLVALGVYYSRVNPSRFEGAMQNEEVLSEVSQEEEEEQEDEENVQEEEEDPTSTPTTEPTAAPSNYLNRFIYPDSVIVSSSSTTLSIETGDNPTEVTDWYKDAIAGENMSVTSFVTTSTNNNILNELVGADGEKEIRVEIEKGEGEERVRVDVTLTSS